MFNLQRMNQKEQCLYRGRMNQKVRCLFLQNESMRKMINYMKMIHSNEGLSSMKRIKEKKV